MTPLLETKLHAPRRRRGVVHRRRLRNRLRGGDQHSLTLVSAPAGFGKTTLLTEWFGDEPRTAWLSLDGRDNDPVLFWSYVVAALQTIVPELGETSLALLQSAPSAMEPMVATLLNELGAIADDIVLVLDDYHMIDSAELHEAMGF